MQAPERLGKYLIRRELGRGAMGVVYEGYDPLIERAVALKVLRLDEGNAELAAELRMRFRREAQAAGRLNHPGIVAIHEYGEDGAAGTAFIAMELVRGRDLKTAFDAGTRFTLQQTGRLMAELLAALQHAHERGVVHRDIKPGNVILLEGGGVKVADFGIARLDTSELTQLGSVLGTVSHMAPEQLTGEPVDGRSDLYSCGVILYQLLTGERPFNGPPASLMHKVLHEQPVPPSQRAPALPVALDAVVLKAMAKEPARRHADARTFAAALHAALAEPRPGATPTPAAEEATVLLPRAAERAVAASAPGDMTLPQARPSSPPTASAPLPPPPPPSTSPSPLPLPLPLPLPSTTTSISIGSRRSRARRVGLTVLGVLGVVAAGAGGYRLFVFESASEPAAVATASLPPTTMRPSAPADVAPSQAPAMPAERVATAPESAPAPAQAESAAAPDSALSSVSPPFPPGPTPPPRLVPKPAPAPAETEPKRPAAVAIAPETVRPARPIPAEPARPPPMAIAPQPVRPAPITPAPPATTRVPPAAAAASEARPMAAASEAQPTVAAPPAKTGPALPSASPRNATAITASPAPMPATPSSPATASTLATPPSPAARSTPAMPPSPAQVLAGRSARDVRPYGAADPIAPLPDAPAPVPAPRLEARIAPADAARSSRAPASAPGAEPAVPRAEPECLEEARRGNARCQVVVGNLYRAGRGVPRDPAEAARWYRKAAEQGSDAGQYELGVMHENGLGVVRNPREAVAWYRKAAAQGHARAQNMLGRAYENALAGQPNLVLAADWYRKAAEQNLPIAEYNLGRLYLSGRGVFKDVAKGQALLQKAAEAGEPNAMVQVAEMYARGEGKPRDRDQAARLYREALGRAGLNDRNREAAERALASNR